jgi:hypothetical protein
VIGTKVNALRKRKSQNIKEGGSEERRASEIMHRAGWWARGASA